MEKELNELLQNTGDGIAELFIQLVKGNWVDDSGHDVRLNKSMINMTSILMAIMEFRHRHLGYEKVKI